MAKIVDHKYSIYDAFRECMLTELAKEVWKIEEYK